MAGLTIRIATVQDATAIAALMRLSIDHLQSRYLTPEQLASSKVAMGLDDRLIDDGTYFLVHDGDALVGCGGWSYRATLYGANHGKGRDDRVLDPVTERAKIRAMYTQPDHIKRGIGRMIVDAGEAAARAHGFAAMELAASAAGKSFYLRCGYLIEREWLDERDGEPVPLALMVKSLA